MEKTAGNPELVTIGSAQLWNGRAEEVLDRVGERAAGMIFTDPPYGHGNNDGDLISNREAALGRGSGHAPRPIANDASEDDADALFELVLAQAPRVLSGGGCCCCCCCCGGGGPDPQFARWAMRMNHMLDFKQMVVWDKGKMGLGWHYRRSYETVLVGAVRGGKHRWFDTSGKVENIIRPGDYGIRKIIPNANEHPTRKPVALAAHFIRLHTRAGETVLDPFMGSGTTGVAALREGRSFIGIELERRWFEQACARIRRVVEGKEAIKDRR